MRDVDRGPVATNADGHVMSPVRFHLEKQPSCELSTSQITVKDSSVFCKAKYRS